MRDYFERNLGTHQATCVAFFALHILAVSCSALAFWFLDAVLQVRTFFRPGLVGWRAGGR